MTVVFYTSGHGFGHATRDSVVMQAILALDPSVRIIVRTSAPARLFPCGDVQQVEVDTGVAQRGSLEVDVLATARQASIFYAEFETRANHEAQALADCQASVVVGDVPPLAFAAAARAGVPAIALANFTWDWIYESYPEFEHLAPGVLRTVRGAYARTSRTLRLPFHGGFAAMPGNVKDLPLVARQSAMGRDEARRRLGIASDRPVILASFGGHGAAVPYARAARDAGLTIMVTDHELPVATGDVPGAATLSLFARDHLAALDVNYPDLVAAADVVVSKPGYGIVSECVANGAALLYARRGRFVEQDVFIGEMPRVLRCREISADDLMAGRWGASVRALLDQDAPPETLAVTGAELAAADIIRGSTR